MAVLPRRERPPQRTGALFRPTAPLRAIPTARSPDADGLDEARTRAIAREFNQPETTFVLRPSLAGATVRLRSFTPAGVEVGGAGHNALGAWLWLEAAGRLAPDDTAGGLRQEIAGQVLPVPPPTRGSSTRRSASRKER